jgi:demethylspheroidene O-methyltransferase
VLAHPGIVAMVEHHPVLYDDLRDPVALLRGRGEGTQMSRYWAYARSGGPAGLDAQAVAEYSALMAASQPLVAGEILDAYPFARHRRLLDVGGGEGAFIGAVARRAPDLELMLFDLPAVVERARARLARVGLGGRVQLSGGSFITDPLPEGADLVSLVRVVHDHDDDVVLDLFERVRRAMAPHGTLLIAEPMAGTGASVPVGEAYFAFYLLAMGSGRSRTFEELAALLRQAGFTDVRWVGARRPIHVGVVTARPR